MTLFWSRPALFLTLLFTLPIVVIRARPYDDPALRALQAGKCDTPCVMGIRPGETSMSAAVIALESNEWVANTRDDFPSPIRNAIFYGVGIYHFVVNWHWSGAQPEWIDRAVDGVMTVEDFNVLTLAVDTHLRLGDIILAYGQPDASALFSGPVADRYSYEAWYATEGMVVNVEGTCPVRRYYDLPVRIVLRPDAPDLPDAVTWKAVC